MSKGLSEQMKQILNEYEGSVDDAIDQALKTTGRQTKAKLKSVSPKDHGDYAQGWSVKRVDDKSIVVYNSKYPGLTHLLTNGHAIVNQTGKYGRLSGDNHIQEVEAEYNEKFEEEIKKQLNNE